MGTSSGAERVGRYELHPEFASGGMASVHFGRLVAEAGPTLFTRTVAIKRLHPQHAKDPEFVAMLLDEARVAARVRHANVVQILDVVAENDEVFLVMDYVHGESLAGLLRGAARAKLRIPPAIAAAIVRGLVEGLDAAHSATSETGAPLGIVHRDVSPENVLVGADGVPRVLDFGVALALGRAQVTREGALKGKLGYMAPELLEGEKATALCDVYSSGVVLWEAMVGHRLFTGEHEGAIFAKVLRGEIPKPSEQADVPPAIDDVVRRATARKPRDRFGSARELARAIEAAVTPASASEVATFVREVAAPALEKRSAMLAAIERGPATSREDEEPTDAIHVGVPSSQSSLAQSTPTEVLIIHASPTLAKTLRVELTQVMTSSQLPTTMHAPMLASIPIAATSVTTTQESEPVVIAAPPAPAPVTAAAPANAGSPPPLRFVTKTIPMAVSSASLIADAEPMQPAPELTQVLPSSRASIDTRRRTGAIAVGAMTLVGVGLLGLALHSTLRSDQRPATDAASAPRPSANATATEAPIDTPAAAATVVVVAATSTPPSPTASAATSASSKRAESSPASNGAPGSTRARPSPRTGGDCDPPYTVDDRGIHHFKPGCL